MSWRPRRPTWPALVAWWVVFLLAWPVRADRVDDLIRQLRGDRDYKVRLSAAVTLGRLGDARAIDPLIGALGDSNKTVRGVAAAALAKVVTEEVPLPVRQRARDALQRTARNDQDAFVRGQAKKALEVVGPLAEEAPPPRVYVEIGPIGDASKKGTPALRAAMREAASQALQRKAPGFLLSLPTGASPTKGDLAKAGVTIAFYVDGSLVSLDVAKDGRSATVSCKVSAFVASYPEKAIFALAEGTAAVEGGSSARDIDGAKTDCVGAVLDNLVSQKIVPVLLARSREQ